MNYEKEFVKTWIEMSFNEVRTATVIKMFGYDDDSVRNVTPLHIGSQIGVEVDDEMVDGVIVDRHGDDFVVELDDNKKIIAGENEISCFSDPFPMWGTMWEVKSDYDLRWFKEHIKEIADLGFVCFDTDDFGWLIGIDAAGCDFYAQYWIPLYRLRTRSV